MPNRDGTGPAGSGPATGRGAGPCGSGDPGTGRFWGRGRGRGRGLGGDFRSGFGRNVSPEQQRSWLEAQAQNLENALRNINDRLANLKK